jgi:hypothetical protein
MKRHPLRHSWCLAATLSCLACHGAGADVLYKWTGPTGVAAFSDTPLEKTGNEARPAERGAARRGPLIGEDVLYEEKLRADGSIESANAQIDLAEHSLALARRPVWALPDAGSLAVARMTSADAERIEFYKKNFVTARQALLAAIQRRRLADAQALAAAQLSPIARE